jgi:hypothetical protein
MTLSAFQATRYFFLFTVGILVVFGLVSFLRITANPGRTVLYGFYALAMFADAALMLYCALQLGRRTRLIFLLSVGVLALNILLTIFDQFGLVDLLFVTLNLITLAALIMARKEFLPA